MSGREYTLIKDPIRFTSPCINYGVSCTSYTPIRHEVIKDNLNLSRQPNTFKIFRVYVKEYTCTWEGSVIRQALPIKTLFRSTMGSETVSDSPSGILVTCSSCVVIFSWVPSVLFVEDVGIKVLSRSSSLIRSLAFSSLKRSSYHLKHFCSLTNSNPSKTHTRPGTNSTPSTEEIYVRKIEPKRSGSTL